MTIQTHNNKITNHHLTLLDEKGIIVEENCLHHSSGYIIVLDKVQCSSAGLRWVEDHPIRLSTAKDVILYIESIS